MQKTNLFVLSILAATLLSSGLFALAAADDGTLDATRSPLLDSDHAPIPDPNDNSTITQDDNQTYHILDDQAPLIAPAPGQEKENGLSAENPSDNSAVPIAIGVVLAVVVGSVVGLLFYRKQAKKTEN